MPDTRVIAATNQDLNAMVKQGRFRADLLDRLGGVFRILTPPLRDHKEDLRALIPAALAKAVARAGLEGRVSMEEAAASLLCAWDYSCPGNVRQFEQFIERLAIGAKRRHGGVISQELLRRYMTEMAQLRDVGADNEAERELLQNRELIERALRLANGNKAQAARDLGVTRNQLRYWHDERRSHEE
jgi:transcriptional regulator with GAF, ATPase, and Fis domain